MVLTAPDESDRSTTSTSTSADFTGLTQGVTYAAQVFAVNSAGESGGSGVATVQIAVEEPSFVVVEGDILENTTWTADKVWVLNKPTFVGRDCGADGNDPDCVQATLTIEPGTTIVGETDLPQPTPPAPTARPRPTRSSSSPPTTPGASATGGTGAA